MPVGKLLLNMSMPMMLSMFVQGLYNIVDSIFVAKLSQESLTAVSLAFPYQNIMIAFGVGTGVGVNALVSRHLGEGKKDQADQVASTGIKLAMITALAFCILSLATVRVYFAAMSGADDSLSPETISGGITYIQICCGISVGVFAQTMLEKLIQSTGRTFYAMVSQMAGAITNCILDPILIFGLLGAPKLGIAGAAVATVGGQFVGSGLALYFNMTKNPEIHLDLKKYRLNRDVVSSIYGIALPSIFMAAVGSVMNVGLNKILVCFSETAVTVFGAYFKLQSFTFMPIFGLNNGMLPIVAYNYGAAKPDRIKQTVSLATRAAMIIMFCGTVLFWILPKQLLLLFSASEEMLAMGIPALRIISLHFAIAGFCIVASSTFQALGEGMLSLIVSVCRQLVALLPIAFLISLIFKDVNMVWLSFPLAEIVSATLCITFKRRLVREKVEPLYQKSNTAGQNHPNASTSGRSDSKSKAGGGKRLGSFLLVLAVLGGTGFSGNFRTSGLLTGIHAEAARNAARTAQKQMTDAGTASTFYPVSYDDKTAMEQYLAWLPPTRVQYRNTCWATAVTALAEISMKMQASPFVPGQKNLQDSVQTPDYYDLGVAYYPYETVTDPMGGTAGDVTDYDGDSIFDLAGDPEHALSTLAKWNGITAEQDLPQGFQFPGNGEQTDQDSFIRDTLAYGLDAAHLEDYYFVDLTHAMGQAKQLIREYGGLAISFRSDAAYYCNETHAFFDPVHTEKEANHTLVAVGWDDHFPKEYFRSGGGLPREDGAFLVRNSRALGAGFAYDGYFWISYETLSLEQFAYALKMGPADNYDVNFQYDGALAADWDMDEIDAKTAANLFTVPSGKNLCLKAVGVYPNTAGTRYRVDIYTGLEKNADPCSGKLAFSSTGSLRYAGFQTLPLTVPVELPEKTRFSIVVYFDDAENCAELGTSFYNGKVDSLVSVKSGQSFYQDGDSWVDLSSCRYAAGTDGHGWGNFRIKAYADEMDQGSSTASSLLAEGSVSQTDGAASAQASLAGDGTKEADADPETVNLAVSSKNIRTDSVTLYWDSYDVADGYMVYVDRLGSWEEKKNLLQGDGSSTKILIDGLISGTNYQFKVVPYELKLGERVLIDHVYGIVTVSTRPAVPKNLKAQVKGKSILLSWDSTGSGQKVEIYRKDGSKSYKKIKTVSSKKGVYSDKAVKSHQVYSYKIRSSKQINGKNLKSGFKYIKKLKLGA